MPIQSMTKRTQQAKLNSAVAVIAMQIAKNNKDQNWVKAARAKKLLLNSRAMILKKYGNQARQQYMSEVNK